MWGKYAGRFSDCHQIWQSANLLAEMGSKSASRFSDCHQIYQSVNLLAEMGGIYVISCCFVGKSSLGLCDSKWCIVVTLFEGSLISVCVNLVLMMQSLSECILLYNSIVDLIKFH